jgi:hypothetical protein
MTTKNRRADKFFVNADPERIFGFLWRFGTRTHDPWKKDSNRGKLENKPRKAQGADHFQVNPLIYLVAEERYSQYSPYMIFRG